MRERMPFSTERLLFKFIPLHPHQLNFWFCEVKFLHANRKNKYDFISVEIDLKKAAKLFANKFSCGSSVTGDDDIVIQGDVSYDVVELIQSTWPEVMLFVYFRVRVSLEAFQDPLLASLDSIGKAYFHRDLADFTWLFFYQLYFKLV